MINAGNYAENKTVYMPFNTYGANGQSITVTDLVAADVKIHKDGGLTQRDNASGITVSIDFDGITGCHLLAIDLSDDTDAGFYAVGSDYEVRLEGITVATQTLNPFTGIFSIENRFAEVDAVLIEGADPTDTIRDSILEDATQFSGGDIETMRGTDNAALDTVCTEARLAELDAANLPADIIRLLGLTGENMVWDDTTYADGKLTGAIGYQYDSKANANKHDKSKGLIGQWTYSGTIVAGVTTVMKRVKES